MEIVRVEHCTKIYGKAELATKALDDVSFSIQKGEFVAIVGPSGSGKSTLLHILGGVDKPTSGEVIVDTTSLSHLSEEKLAVFRRRQVGLVYQFYNLIPVLSVEDNIALPLLLDGRTPDNKTIEELLETLNLQKQRKYLPNQLSGGQQQRVSLGRALVNQPALVLADEPTGNLDSYNSAQVMQLLRKANQLQNQTCIIITHDEKIAMQADRIISIEDGKIACDEVLRK